MNTYETIKPWLEKSQRNEFFFKNEASLPVLRTLRDEYVAASQILSQALEKPMTREHYLDWRKAWRAAYAKLSSEIRWTKNGRKTSQIDSETLVARNRTNAEALSGTAGWFMELRTISKEKAREAHEIERAARLAA